MQIDQEESEMGPNRRRSQDALVNSSIERSGTVLFDHSNQPKQGILKNPESTILKRGKTTAFKEPMSFDERRKRNVHYALENL